METTIKTRKRGRPAGSGQGGGLFQRGDKWGFRLRIDGRDTKKLVGTRQEAMIALGHEIENRRLGKAGMPKKNWTTLREYVETTYRPWSLKTKRAASLRSDASKQKLILEILGDDLLSGLNEKRFDALRDRLLSDGRKATTVNKFLHSVIAVLHHAVATGAIAAMPCRVRMEREPPLKQVVDLSAEQEAAILASLPAHYRWAVKVALQTGMREGEIINLVWADIDLPSRSIIVRDSKTGRSRRVPLSDDLFSEMQSRPRGLPSALVVPGIKGERIGATALLRSFKLHASRAGRPDLVFHDLRHIVASRLLNAGCSITQISDLLGHATLAMSRRYSHSDPAVTRAFLDKIGSRKP